MHNEESLFCSSPFQVFEMFFGKEQCTCSGGRTVAQADLYIYLPTGESECLVTIELLLSAYRLFHCSVFVVALT